MIKINKLTFNILSLICVSMTVACSSQSDIIDEITNDEEKESHTCELILNVTKTGFEDEMQSRSAENWESGDKIYLTFKAGTGTAYGIASYYNGTWSVDYYGQLTQGATAKCTAVYFDNADYVSGSVVNLTEETGIYEDLTGSYIYSGGTMTVIANLKPKTGRIRFSGTGNDDITVYGISHYATYDYTAGKFTKSAGAFKSTVSSASLYTPYVYGEFTDSIQPRLNIITKSSGFTRMLSTTIYQPGESGYMTIPTETSLNGWINTVRLKVNGVEFTMIPVTYSYGNFLLAETETTEELYNAIMGETKSTSQTPKCGLSYSNWETFISKLKTITGLKFRMPTSNEWKYAAKGGSKSQGYSYSGSNTISNVAWYYNNSSSVQPVKKLQPNELGFYDMSGNVSEVVDANYSYYNDWYGGSWKDSASNCQVTSYDDIGSSSTTVSAGGLRIALSNN